MQTRSTRRSLLKRIAALAAAVTVAPAVKAEAAPVETPAPSPGWINCGHTTLQVPCPYCESTYTLGDNAQPWLTVNTSHLTVAGNSTFTGNTGFYIDGDKGWTHNLSIREPEDELLLSVDRNDIITYPPHLAGQPFRARLI